MLRELHTELGIPLDYGGDGTKPVYEEATELVEVGPNLVGRMQRLISQRRLPGPPDSEKNQCRSDS